jgi:hypothetical protein
VNPVTAHRRDLAEGAPALARHLLAHQRAHPADGHRHLVVDDVELLVGAHPVDRKDLFALEEERRVGGDGVDFPPAAGGPRAGEERHGVGHRGVGGDGGAFVGRDARDVLAAVSVLVLPRFRHREERRDLCPVLEQDLVNVLGVVLFELTEYPGVHEAVLSRAPSQPEWGDDAVLR